MTSTHPGTLTLHLNLRRDPKVLFDAADKGLSATDVLWESVTSCQVWLSYSVLGVNVTYSMSEKGPTRDRELGMEGELSASRALSPGQERAFFNAIETEFGPKAGEARGERGHLDRLRFVATVWEKATGLSLVREGAGEILDARSLAKEVERLSLETNESRRSYDNDREWTNER